MILTIKNKGSRSYGYFNLFRDKEYFCSVNNKADAELIIKTMMDVEYPDISEIIAEDFPANILKRIIRLKGTNLATDTSNKREVVELRYIFCKLTSNLGFTLVQIGKMINRDHSTVHAALRKFDIFYEVDEKFRALYHEIKNVES